MINLSRSMEMVFNMQKEFQKMLGNEVPCDNPDMLAHHLLGLVTEIGEVAQADKRWKKNKRNDHYSYDEKLKEIADVFIFLINVCLYSNITSYQLINAVSDKIEENIERYKKAEEEQNDRDS